MSEEELEPEDDGYWEGESPDFDDIGTNPYWDPHSEFDKTEWKEGMKVRLKEACSGLARGEVCILKDDNGNGLYATCAKTKYYPDGLIRENACLCETNWELIHEQEDWAEVLK